MMAKPAGSFGYVYGRLDLYDPIQHTWVPQIPQNLYGSHSGGLTNGPPSQHTLSTARLPYAYRIMGRDSSFVYIIRWKSDGRSDAEVGRVDVHTWARLFQKCTTCPRTGRIELPAAVIDINKAIAALHTDENPPKEAKPDLVCVVYLAEHGYEARISAEGHTPWSETRDFSDSHDLDDLKHSLQSALRGALTRFRESH